MRIVRTIPDTHPPPCFLKVLIPDGDKVACFHRVLKVWILKGVDDASRRMKGEHIPYPHPLFLRMYGNDWTYGALLTTLGKSCPEARSRSLTPSKARGFGMTTVREGALKAGCQQSHLRVNIPDVRETKGLEEEWLVAGGEQAKSGRGGGAFRNGTRRASPQHSR